ncbi:MAG: asparagine synthase (glutamine-hydrolyzing) [Thermodesulfobacteriota bacterium]
MCGIVGFVDPRAYAARAERLAVAVSRLRHRGPDDSGVYLDPSLCAGFGQCRLSIIDLSAAGHQPMETEDGKWVIVYNGETYNFADIRRELEARGETFRTLTDTEVVLKAFRAWGPDCLSRMRGMFALAVLDRENRRVFLARDRLGKKPLYYRADDQRLFFASELKALRAFPGVAEGTDPDALALFLHYQYIPAPWTIHPGVRKLRPGCFAVFENGRLGEETAYWSLPPCKEDPGITEPDAVDELDRLLCNAVSDRLVADVPVGALLSGGIDSSLVAAFLSKAGARSVKTFSIGFSEEAYNEAPYAKAVAGHLGCDHTELFVSEKDALAVVPRLPEIYDEPFADPSGIPTHLVSVLARRNVTVALSGDGGDEQFAGYVRYWMTQALDRGIFALPRAARVPGAILLKRAPVKFLNSLYVPIRPLLPQRFRVENFPDKWNKMAATLDQKDIVELYRMTVCVWTARQVRDLCGLSVPRGPFEEAFAKSDSWPALRRAMYVDQNTYLPDAMLTKVDRASMATSLEVRVPLLDHRIFEFTARLPQNLLYRDGTGKYLAKKLLARYVPPKLFLRPKMGFGVPIETWLRRELKPLLQDYLSPARIRAEGLFSPDLVEQTVREHLSGAKNHQYRLWALLMWEMWREASSGA